jgi:hypothetical protein
MFIGKLASAGSNRFLAEKVGLESLLLMDGDSEPTHAAIVADEYIQAKGLTDGMVVAVTGTKKSINSQSAIDMSEIEAAEELVRLIQSAMSAMAAGGKQVRSLKKAVMGRKRQRSRDQTQGKLVKQRMRQTAHRRKAGS